MSTSQPAGHLTVECLVEQGMEIVFGVPGASFLAVLDGFHACRERARFIVNRQEGGAAFRRRRTASSRGGRACAS